MLPRRKLLIVAATTGYQAQAFAAAARRAGIEFSLATDRCHVLDDPWGDSALPVRFDAPEASVPSLSGFDAVVAVGDRPAYLAALAAERLGLPFHPARAVAAARNKFEARERFRSAGLLVPEYSRVSLDADPAESARAVAYPCVLKPLGLSASRGVIRADDPAGFVRAFRRIRSILETAEVARFHDAADRFIQVERFIPGREFAVEALVTEGRFHPLAIFDKPDPLDGPYFEETIYVTPSRAPAAVQAAIRTSAEIAAAALGLTQGPIHAEMRVNDNGVWILEAAGRPIGGLCARSLTFDGGLTLEDVIVQHALGQDTSGVARESQASGVMMIPIPREGLYRGVRGVDAASRHAEVLITATAGQHFQPLPEGHSYLGFLFARSAGAAEVELLLRAAHAELSFDLAAVVASVPGALPTRPSPPVPAPEETLPSSSSPDR